MQSCATVALVIPANKSLPQISLTRDSRMLTLPKDGPLQLGSALAVRYGERVGALKMEAREAEERALEELQWKIGRMLVAQQHQRAQWELGGWVGVWVWGWVSGWLWVWELHEWVVVGAG